MKESDAKVYDGNIYSDINWNNFYKNNKRPSLIKTVTLICSVKLGPIAT